MSWQPIDTVPKDGTEFLVTGGFWQSDEQSNGMSNDRPVRVKYAARLNLTDSPFIVTEDDEYCAIRNPTSWKSVCAR